MLCPRKGSPSVPDHLSRKCSLLLSFPYCPIVLTFTGNGTNGRNQTCTVIHMLICFISHSRYKGGVGTHTWAPFTQLLISSIPKHSFSFNSTFVNTADRLLHPLISMKGNCCCTYLHLHHKASPKTTKHYCDFLFSFFVRAKCMHCPWTLQAELFSHKGLS